MSLRRTQVLGFFFGILLVYAAFSPFAISAMGYTAEDMTACRELIAGTPPSRVHWPRNGAAGLLVECPFLAASSRTSDPAVWDERLLALEPVLMSALLATLLFAWCTRLSGSPLRGLTLALAAGLCTMLWPYAYIGLETTQSLFLLAAGYLALSTEAPLRWPRALAFGLCGGMALSAKTGGILLVPAVAFLAWRLAASGRAAKWGWGRAAAAVLVGVLVFGLNAIARATWWKQYGGMERFARFWAVRDLASPFLNAAALVGSPNKGLLVYAPLSVLGLLALPRAYRAERSVAIFAALTVAGLVGGVSVLGMWSDETWGPRYLHAAIAPLVLCLASAKRSTPLRARSEIPLWACALLGFAVSLLGCAFYYGTLAGVAAQTTPITIEALQGDPVWNPVRFNARLLQVWWRVRRGHADLPEYLRGGIPWDPRDAVNRVPWVYVDLRPRSVPQSLLLQFGDPWSSRPRRIARWTCLLSLIAGAALLARELRRARSLESSRPDSSASDDSRGPPGKAPPPAAP